MLKFLYPDSDNKSTMQRHACAHFTVEQQPCAGMVPEGART